jgi:hypothetical protein
MGMGWSKGRLQRIAITVIAFLAAVALDASASKVTTAGTCEGETVVDYRAPLEALPPVRSVPVTEKLPFGPAGIALAEVGNELAVGPSAQGFRLAYRGSSPSPLGWELEAQLRRVSTVSPEGHLLASKRAELAGAAGGRKRLLIFPVSSKPALYRITMSITDAEGRRLGRFGRYVRVLPDAPSAVLNILGGPHRPGEWVGGCVENRGTVALQSGYTRLERLEDSGWRPVFVGPQYAVGSSAILRNFLPGEAERIFAYLPPDAGPGTYRLAWTGLPLRIGNGPSRPEPGLPAVELSAGFEVPAP